MYRHNFDGVWNEINIIDKSPAGWTFWLRSGSGWDECKNRDFRTGLVGMGFSRDCFGIFRDFSGLQNIVIIFLILQLSFSMMRSLAQLMCFWLISRVTQWKQTLWAFVILDFVVHTLNVFWQISRVTHEYKHCEPVLFLTLLCTHFMCLDRSPESLIEYCTINVVICCPWLRCAHTWCVLTHL
jgi:hypothetical protein